MSLRQEVLCFLVPLGVALFLCLMEKRRRVNNK